MTYHLLCTSNDLYKLCTVSFVLTIIELFYEEIRLYPAFYL